MNWFVTNRFDGAAEWDPKSQFSLANGSSSANLDTTWHGQATWPYKQACKIFFWKFKTSAACQRSRYDQIWPPHITFQLRNRIWFIGFGQNLAWIYSLSYYFKVLKRIVHKNSLYIYWMSHLHFPWVGYGEGSGISGRLFIGFRTGVRGTTFRFCYCATFHVSGSCSNPTQERDLNVCIMCMYNVYCMYNFNLLNT